MDNKTKTNASLKIVLIGNPNVGKSVVSAHLTGRYVTVSNYPGTTVEITQGVGEIEGKKIEIIDAPGLNSLIPSSEDELVARDILLEEKLSAVIQVADSKNLKRTLLLTIQLIEMGIPLILNLNMIDELRQRRIKIDVLKLAGILGIKIVQTVAIEGEGIGNLKRNIFKAKASNFKIDYGSDVEKAVDEIVKNLENWESASRAIGLMFLSYDKDIEKLILEKCGRGVLEGLERIRARLQEKYSRRLNNLINEIRNRETAKLVEQVLSIEKSSIPILQRFGDLTMKPFPGFPFLLLVLYLMYKFVGEFAAQNLVDLLENNLFGNYLNPWAAAAVRFLIPFKIIQEFLVGEYGLISMALTYALALILPILSSFFLFFSILEDSGYLPRLAILLNRSFRFIGLSGKAVIPMVLGLGCDTMATMTSRTLETKKERIIATLLLALAIPCSAQLGVILGMIGSVSALATLIWLSVVIIVLLLVGFLAARIIPGSRSDFVLEIPPLRIPKLSNILIKTLARIEWYLMEAVPLFISGTALLFFLDRINVLKVIEKLTSPLVVSFLGLPPKATEAFLVGFLRRDYGAAGLFALAKEGLLDPTQIVVSLVTITLFVPCIAQFMVMIKERGLKVTLLITAFIFPFAFLVGGIVNFLLRFFRVFS